VSNYTMDALKADVEELMDCIDNKVQTIDNLKEIVRLIKILDQFAPSCLLFKNDKVDLMKRFLRNPNLALTSRTNVLGLLREAEREKSSMQIFVTNLIIELQEIKRNVLPAMEKLIQSKTKETQPTT